MAYYDSVKVYYKLPNDEPFGTEFVTGSLWGTWEELEVSHDGRLLMLRRDDKENLIGKADLLYHGLVIIEDDPQREKKRHYRYGLLFNWGKLIKVSIKQKWTK